ncbi:MAG TPA: glycosyltransferase family 4 protein [Anaerolineae bacterium]|nr:glycosyltransferase family 4 protein [Anaerolineae bacterium]
MRILHVVHQYPPDHVGGTEHYSQGLATAQVKAGHSAAVFYPRSGQSRLDVEARDGVEVYSAGAGARSRLDVFTAVFGSHDLQAQFDRVLDSFRPDVVHVQHLIGLPLSIVHRARQAGRRCVFTLHDYWALCGNAQMLTNYDRTTCDGPRLWLNCARCAAARAGQPGLMLGAPALAALFGLRARLIRRMLRQIDIFLAPSRLVGQMAVRAGADLDRVRHVPYGIDKSGVRPRVARSDGEFRVVYIGSLAWQKGVHVLVEAFNQVPEPATLSVYGDPGVFPEYSRALQALARSPRIRFAGKLSRADLWPTLAEADLVAVPSVWYENQPLAILEAFAAGVPVMASDLGALPELIEQGRTGWRVKAGNVEAWTRALAGLVTGATPRIDRVEAAVSEVAGDHLSRVVELYQ